VILSLFVRHPSAKVRQIIKTKGNGIPGQCISKDTPTELRNNTTKEQVVSRFLQTTQLAFYWPRPVSFFKLRSRLNFIIEDLPQEDPYFKRKFRTPHKHQPSVCIARKS
jgi:hypothetical protein